MSRPQAVALLRDLTSHGFELRAERDLIRFRPRAAMTPKLLARIRAERGELLQLLRERDAGPLPAADGKRAPRDPSVDAVRAAFPGAVVAHDRDFSATADLRPEHCAPRLTPTELGEGARSAWRDRKRRLPAEPPRPPRFCYRCGTSTWWRASRPTSPWRCHACCPPAPHLRDVRIWPEPLDRENRENRENREGG